MHIAHICAQLKQFNGLNDHAFIKSVGSWPSTFECRHFKIYIHRGSRWLSLTVTPHSISSYASMSNQKKNGEFTTFLTFKLKPIRTTHTLTHSHRNRKKHAHNHNASAVAHENVPIWCRYFVLRLNLRYRHIHMRSYETHMVHHIYFKQKNVALQISQNTYLCVRIHMIFVYVTWFYSFYKSSP